MSVVCVKGERDRDQNVVQTLRDRQNLHQIFERKAELAVRAEADVEVKHWETRNSDIVRSIREDNTCVEKLSLRNRRFREDQAKYCQCFEELRRLCEEADRAREARSDELSLHQERIPRC